MVVIKCLTKHLDYVNVLEMEGVIQLSAGKVAAEENLFSSFLTPERVS